MNRFNKGLFSANYYISLYGISLNFVGIDYSEINIPEFMIEEVEVDSRFKQYADKYLAYELVSFQKEIKQAVANAFLNANDIQLFISSYEELLNSDSEIKMGSVLQGEGGALQMKVQLKPLALINVSIMYSCMRLLICFAVVIGIILLSIKYNFLPLLLYIGIFIITGLFQFVAEEIKQLKTLKKELKVYG